MAILVERTAVAAVVEGSGPVVKKREFRVMEDRGQERPEGGAEDTDILLSSRTAAHNVAEAVRVSWTSQSQSRPAVDRCDLLLDAIDDQLTHLQAQSHRVEARREDNRSRTRADHISTAHLGKSESEDTRLGGSILASDDITSPQNLAFSELLEASLGRISREGNPITDGEDREKSTQVVTTWELEGGMDSKTEQCKWRLKHLLGSADTVFESALPHGTDSICTEDFAARFREEMVAPISQNAGGEEDQGFETPAEEQLPDQEEQVSSPCPPLGGTASQTASTRNRFLGSFCSTQCVHPTEFAQESSLKTGRNRRECPFPTEVRTKCTASVRDRYTRGSLGGSAEKDAVIPVNSSKEEIPKLRSMSAQGTGRSPVTTWGGTSDTDLHFNPSSSPGCHYLREPESRLCSPPRVEGHILGNREHAGNRDLLPLGFNSHSSNPQVCNSGATPPGSTDGHQGSCGKDVVMTSRSNLNIAGVQKDSSRFHLHSRVRHLAGVPLWNFDMVNIDSDLDSVQTTRVQEHIQNTLRSNAAGRSVKFLQACDVNSDQSELDTDVSGPRSRPRDRKGSRFKVSNGIQFSRKSHHNRKASRRVKPVNLEDEEESDPLEREEEGRFCRHFPLQRELGPQSLKSKSLERVGSDRLRMEEAISNLRLDCKRVEERLRQRTAELRKTELSLAELLQRKTHAMQELECLQATMRRASCEGQELEPGVSSCKSQVDSARSQLHTLQVQRDAYLHKAREKDMAKRQNISLTILEREELERQLARAKGELFAVQRQARHRLEALQERLEETQQELEQHTEGERTLKKRCSELEEQLESALRKKEQKEQDQELELLRSELTLLKELHVQQVNQAKEQEQKKWETEMEKEIQRRCGILKKQSHQAVERVREEAERERRSSLGLQIRVSELKNHVKELEREVEQRQHDQDSALSALRRTLTEEHQAELQQLRRHSDQDRRREVTCLQGAVEQAEGQVHALQEAAAKAEQQQRDWALELGVECQRLQELLKQGGSAEGVTYIQQSSTVGQAAQTLQVLVGHIHVLVTRLRQQLDAQRRANHKLAQDKEQELQAQREQLGLQQEKALESLKERLIQEHIKEISSLQRTKLHDSTGEGGGLVVSLRRQLRDKDAELQEVQKNMSRWKEQTTARLAQKFEEELMAELERRALRSSADQQRKLQRLEDEEQGRGGLLRYTSTPSLLSTEPCFPSMSPDLATLKLLRHLQCRIRQLHSWAHTCCPMYADPQTPAPRHSCSPTHLATAGDLAGSYLETIGPRAEGVRVRGRFHTRMVHT
ncbi:trichohyalin-like isoform X1 [Arapaima gigas]